MTDPAADLLGSLAALARNRSADLAWFADRMTDAARLETPAERLPHHDLIAASAAHASAETREATTRLIAASGALRWRRSYTAADGFSPAYLDRYGWVNLVSPEGLFLSPEMRVSIGYWGAGLTYPEHSHAPEEIYLILAGGAVFSSEGRAPRVCGAGDIVHHRPHQRHSMAMRDGPMLAAAFWRGEGLLRKPDL